MKNKEIFVKTPLKNNSKNKLLYTKKDSENLKKRASKVESYFKTLKCDTNLSIVKHRNPISCFSSILAALISISNLFPN